ncbi:hypothetical protein [Cylindrospermopsis curvispora]|uniref:Uncharacterized protein n=1 Tax=Cylindrospermopsis curvispora GIHE-G1 TaxID=2666332 RepID=A0A7H0F3U7_9CYAN|nr:hypothetical protein [Cylindrospermopsis curvispora]QNP30713.1 hypothetical protein IAR63_06875 [Cylindrospermopsis curvispora GIHE-G1]
MFKIKDSTPPIIAKTLVVAGFAASVLLSAAPAKAITLLNFPFQFQDVTGGTNGLVKGTLIGLQEGNNPGSGITAQVTSSPNNQGLGIYNFHYAASNAFTVTGGIITYANASFSQDGNYLNLGTYGNDGYSNRLQFFRDDSNSTTSFTADGLPLHVTPVPFESDSGAVLAALGICFGASKLWKKHLAKKRMVGNAVIESLTHNNV